MRAVLISFALMCGCASTLSTGPQAARSEKKSSAVCEDLGRVVFNPRNPALDPTQTMGPSQVIWLHPKPTGYLTVHDGHAYRCAPES